MKFRFSTIDLFLITAVVAGIAGSLRVEAFFFRQMIWLALVAIGSTSFVAYFSNAKRKSLPAAIGGALGGVVFLGICFLLRERLFLDSWDFSPNSITAFGFDLVSISIEMGGFFLASIPMGAALGPLIALRFREEFIGETFLKRFWLSIILGVAALLLALFSVYERKLMSDRDWNLVLIVVVAFFVIHSINWFRRMELAEQRDISAIGFNENAVDPVHEM